MPILKSPHTEIVGDYEPIKAKPPQQLLLVQIVGWRWVRRRFRSYQCGSRHNLECAPIQIRHIAECDACLSNCISAIERHKPNPTGSDGNGSRLRFRTLLVVAASLQCNTYVLLCMSDPFSMCRM